MQSVDRAREILADPRIVWYQRFELVPGLWTPGVADTVELMSRAGMPDDMTGRSVLDIGTSNGGLAFEAERRGASRVVAVDIYEPTWFGFSELAEFFGSKIEFVRATVYELPTVLDERFDIVAFLGVLYHLRHPLLGLDAVRQVAKEWVFIESAVADAHLPAEVLPGRGIVSFFRSAELSDDSSNWFAPTTATLFDWCRSAGLEPEILDCRPDAGRPERCAIRARVVPGEPEYERLSYEVPLRVRADLTPVPERRH